MNAVIASSLQTAPSANSELILSSCLPLKLYPHASLLLSCLELQNPHLLGKMMRLSDWHTMANGSTQRIVKFLSLIEKYFKIG